MTQATHEPRTRPRLRPDVFSALAGVAAMFAPAALTGVGPIDAVERAVLATFVSYVGAHGRRWTWLAAAAVVCVPARGTSLLIALAALIILTGAAWPKKRSRVWGAIGLGTMVNAILWYPSDTRPAAIVLAIAAMGLVVWSGIKYLRPTKRRAARIGLLVAAGFVAVAFLLAGVAMVLAYGQVRSGGNAARDALEGARDGNAEAARTNLSEATSAFETASSRVSGPLTYPALLVPVLSQQVQAVATTVDQGRHISGTADDLVATADYDRLQYDGRLDLEQVRALAEPTARADQALADADAELRGLDGAWLLPPLRDRIDEFSADIDQARRDTAVASKLLKVTPGLFGADGERRYLVVFQTPAELRGSGGFIGSYAELVAKDGKVTLERSGRIADLIFGPNQGKRTISGPADYLRRYGRFHPGEFIQDATLSPDFPSVGQVLAELYPQVGGSEVDGVIAVDPSGLAALLELTGPVDVEGLDEPLSADNAVEVLTRQQYIDLPNEAQRGEILTEATRVTFEQLISSALPAPRTLAETLSPAARSGHLRLWSPDPTEQAVFEQLGATGDLKTPTGSDGLSIVQQNTGNNKLDAYLHRTITYLPTVDAETGKLTAELRIELHNDVPSVDLPDPVVGNSRGLPVGTNLTWLTIFTPNVVTSATIDGEPAQLGPSRERKLNAFDTQLLQIPPGGEVVIVVKLAGGVDLTHGYGLTILPQPVANPDQFTSTLSITNGTDPRTGSPEVQLVEGEPLTAPTRFRVPIDR